MSRFRFRLQPVLDVRERVQDERQRDLALKKRPVFIRRGQRILQLVEATLPEPIPHFPEGHFAVGEERAAYLNSLPVDPEPLDR